MLKSTYDFVIIGLGPAGITTALHLATTGKNILCLEAMDGLGGCWNTYQDRSTGLFVEHSPKVLSKYGSKEFNNLCRYLEVDNHYVDVYDNRMKSSMLFKSSKYLSILDIIKLIITFIFYLLGLLSDSITVKDWCKNYNISTLGQKYLNVICIILSSTYDKIQLKGLFQFILKRYQYLLNLNELSNPKDWLINSLNKLEEYENITIQFNSIVTKLIKNNNQEQISEIVINKNNKIKCQNVIMCVPIRSLYKIMSYSGFANWFDSLDLFLNYVEKASYTGIGFQLHFSKSFTPPEWCWSCFGDWKVIVLQKNDKKVLSCVIVDLESKSKHINKSVNECDNLEEIIKEGIRQIYDQNKKDILPKLNKVTSLKKNIFKDPHFGWESWDSSFSNMGSIPFKGKCSNLFTVGPHNVNEIVLIETAIYNAKKFCSNFLKIQSLF